MRIPGFQQPADDFDPQRVFLADLDGSGTPDLVYAHSDRLLIYFNQSGNRFSVPQTVQLPDGIYYDHRCQLTLTDIRGVGVASIVLSVPHPVPRHWRYDFVQKKTGLLTEVNNNLGANYQLNYQSSAQCWLKEKGWLEEKALLAKAVLTSPTPVIKASHSDLPFPLHLLVKTVRKDEITGNQLTQRIRYRHGVYDGIEREFRGFGRVDIWDSEVSADEEVHSFPALTCHWYHTGREQDDTRYQNEYWSQDKQAFPCSPTRLTYFSGNRLVA